jgi:hypothetical protein
VPAFAIVRKIASCCGAAKHPFGWPIFWQGLMTFRRKSNQHGTYFPRVSLQRHAAGIQNDEVKHIFDLNLVIDLHLEQLK